MSRGFLTSDRRSGGLPLDPDLFPARVSAVITDAPTLYLFREQWLAPDKIWHDIAGGRVNTPADPGVCRLGTLAVGSPVLVRHAPGTGNLMWELYAVAAGTGDAGPCDGYGGWGSAAGSDWALSVSTCSPGCLPAYPTFCPPADGTNTTRTPCYRRATDPPLCGDGPTEAQCGLLNCQYLSWSDNTWILIGSTNPCAHRCGCRETVTSPHTYAPACQRANFPCVPWKALPGGGPGGAFHGTHGKFALWHAGA